MGKPCVLKCYVYPDFLPARQNFLHGNIGEGKQIDLFSNDQAR